MESKEDDNDEPTPAGGTKNKGNLQLDSTVADAQIKFPTDLYLLSDSRVKAEDLIDHLCKELDIKDKPRTSPTYNLNQIRAKLYSTSMSWIIVMCVIITDMVINQTIFFPNNAYL